MSSNRNHPAKRDSEEWTEAAAVEPPSATEARNAARAFADGAYRFVSRIPGSFEMLLYLDQRDQARIGGAACPGSGAPRDLCQLSMKVDFGYCSWLRKIANHPENSPALTAILRRM